MRTVVDMWRALPYSFRVHPFVQLIGKHVKPFIATHNDMYWAGFFEEIEPAVRHAAPIIAQSIVNELGLARVVDVGCGTGALLKALQDLGCSCFGLEYADPALEMCRSRGLAVTKFDIEHDEPPSHLGRFDATVSLEVAEHLPERCADRYVELLCGLSPVLFFSAATPGQGGLDHVNEQPHDYWIDRFKTHSFLFESVLSDKLRAAWQAQGVVSWYHRNVMVFRRRSAVDC
jgi:SAM-dependent methyltransferase